ncbi:MAG: pyridoxal phosphate-dependent aminotransferase [Bacteroidetes bacterium]|nr:MAG: pyridoxal phosphate-dependent aminotransferase [Bacteroidota bacterium]
MIHLSNRINQLSESETLAMSRKSRELKAQGHDVINLSLGEPDFYTPDDIKKAAKIAIDENYTFYTPVNGYPELRKAISQKLKRDNNLDYSPEEIVTCTGAKQAIINALLCLVNPGDEVIIPTPYWVSYSQMVTIAEGKQVYIEAGIKNDFKITPAQLENAITPKTRLFMFSSPCNPTGSVYSKAELEGLARVFEKHPNVYILSDEIYELINFNKNHESIARFESLKDRVVLINGVSKGFAMTGWRLGYMASHIDIAKAVTKLQGQYTSATCSIAQKAAQKAMEILPEDTWVMLDKFRERRDLVLELMKDIPGMKTNIPQGAFYIFPDISSYFGKRNGEHIINDANDFCMYLLNNAFVALVPGDAFGAPNCIRFSYATSNELLIEAVKRIKSALSELN